MAAKVNPDYERAYKLTELGYSLATIAPILGVTPQAVHYALKKKGLNKKQVGAKQIPAEFLKTG